MKETVLSELFHKINTGNRRCSKRLCARAKPSSMSRSAKWLKSFHGSLGAPLGKHGSSSINMRVFQLLEALFMSIQRRLYIGKRNKTRARRSSFHV